MQQMMLKALCLAEEKMVKMKPIPCHKIGFPEGLDYAIWTDKAKVGELISELESESCIWSLYDEEGNPLGISNYWISDSQNHSRYDGCEIAKIVGWGGVYTPVEVRIWVKGEKRE